MFYLNIHKKFRFLKIDFYVKFVWNGCFKTYLYICHIYLTSEVKVLKNYTDIYAKFAKLQILNPVIQMKRVKCYNT